MARLLVFIQVGPIRIIGRDHLAAMHGPVLLAANHPFWTDPFVLSQSLDLPDDTHYPSARGNLTAGLGLGARLAPFPVVPVDLTPGRGLSALRTCTRLLVDGTSLVIFPEGWAQMDGRRGAFKGGAVFMARQAAHARGAPVPIVPVYLQYARVPGAWIRRFSPLTQYLIALASSAVYRRGVTVHLGAPIDPHTLPADATSATRILEERVHRLAASDL